MEFIFATADTSFNCTRCSRCCSLDVMLSDREMEALGRDADPKWHTTRKVFKGKEPVCCELQGNACTIYTTRPKLCRIYPFFAIPVADLEAIGEAVPDSALRIMANGEAYVVAYDDRCPGMGQKGPLDLAEIVSITIDHRSEFEPPINPVA